MKISTADSRFSLAWKNTDMTWEALIKRLSLTKRTSETVEQFKKMPKLQQDKIKDVGGFVGGWLKDGKRRTNTVLSRSMLTLDLDFASKDFWDMFTIMYYYQCLVYSTHKHTPESPRLRLVVPLSREVTPEEYEAIARKVAEEVGIDQFDDTTYQPSRLMYWPSTSSDGEYFFKVQEGEVLNVDEYLKKYSNWKDVAQWPVSSRQKDVLRVKKEKAEDPLTKQGVIGAFCRAYSITDAITEFLSDVYTPTSKEDRFTYVHGSTAAGLIVYDDKFAYSNHSTDPCSGQLCNAFDLVRIHKYGELDAELGDSNKSQTKRPSFSAMSTWAANLDKVRTELLENILDDDDDADLIVSPTANAVAADKKAEKNAIIDWAANLSFNKSGRPNPTIENAVIILQNDPHLKGLGRLNLFSNMCEGNPDLPWSRSIVEWSDSDESNLRLYLERKYDYASRADLADAVKVSFSKKSYHPVRDYLNSLPPWDGVERVDTLLIRCLGADDTPYVRAVTRKTLTAAVARVMEPGCKFDYMLTLIGAQGTGKSLFSKLLAKDWFSDTNIAIQGKDAFEGLAGVWIQEIGELSSFKKAEVEQVKAFISKTSDTYRRAYEHNARPYPRQNIFIGTSNDSQPLRDDTGNRRFWVVDCKQEKGIANPELLKLYKKTNKDADKEINNIWAEALYRYKHGEDLELSPELKAIASQIQEDHKQEDPRLGFIKDYLEILLPDNWEALKINDRITYLWGSNFEDTLPKHEGNNLRKKVCAAEIWCECFKKPRETLTRFDAREINQMLELCGWKPISTRESRLYGKQKCYGRPLVAVEISED